MHCEAEPDAAAAGEASTPGEPVLPGSWLGDASCVPEMEGMEGADQGTIATVAAQIERNTFVFTDATMEHRIGSAAGSSEPYAIVAHEGATWTIEMAGPRGAAQRTDLSIDGDRMRMSRGGALVICLRRAP